MKKLKRLLLFLLIQATGVFLVACATIFWGPTQNIDIQSNPEGAEIWHNGKNTGKTTPASVNVKRKGENKKQSFVLRKEGFSDFNYEEKRHLAAGWIVLDYYCGIFPIFIDWANGSFFSFTKSHQFNLIPLRPSENPNNLAESYQDKMPKNSQVESGLNQGMKNSGNTFFEGKSDVDTDIPECGKTYPYRFALIIGNEDYASYQNDLSSEVNVAFAQNDALAFQEYAKKTMGLPEENITLLLNGTLAQMNQAIAKINLLAKNTSGKAEIIFYYAGHGLPDENTKEPYLIPVDVSGAYGASGIALAEVYKKLTEHRVKKISVFLDACFSGGARNQGLVSARGVKIKPRQTEIANAPMVVFSASSGEQSALPYKDKKHGLFTYLLLKKLKESKGQISYGQLSDALKEDTGIKSILINNKEQNSQTNVSPSLGEEWKYWRFVE